MNALRRLFPLGPLALAALLPLVSSPAPACAPAFRAGASVRIADENVLILWDAATKTQHFIRRTTFQTNARDFGFLVPTPSKPEVKEAPNELFATMDEWTKPEVIFRNVYGPPSGSKFGGGRGMAPMGAAPAPAVRVVDAGRVGNLNFTVLEANNAQALTNWLMDNGYATRPALTEWLERYIEQKWFITAFKIATGGGGLERVADRAVHMAFQTEKPFHPYREPIDMRAPGVGHPPRLMRVFFVGPERVQGRLGLAPGANWSGQPVWADALSAHQRGQLLAKLPLPHEAVPERSWLTVFEDTASPRQGTDEVYFEPTAPAVLHRPPVTQEIYIEDRSGSMGPGGSTASRGPMVLPFAAAIFGSVAMVLSLTVLAWWLSARRA